VPTARSAIHEVVKATGLSQIVFCNRSTLRMDPSLLGGNVREHAITFQRSTTRMCSASRAVRVPAEWSAMDEALTTKHLRKALDTMVVNASRALCISSLVLDLYARLCHDAGNMMEFKVAIRQAMVVCVKGARYPRVAQVGTAFRMLLPELETALGCTLKPHGGNLPALWLPGQVMTFASNAMWSSTLWLYSTEAIWKHVHAVLRARFPGLKPAQRDCIISRLRLRGSNADPDGWADDDMITAWAWLEGHKGLLQRFRELARLMTTDSHEPGAGAKRDAIMSQAASIRIEMLRLMEAEIDTEPSVGLRFRRFAVIPEFRVRRHFVRVDKDVLQDVLKHMLSPICRLAHSRKRQRPQEGDISVQNESAAHLASPGWPPGLMYDLTSASGRAAFLDRVEALHVLAPSAQWKSIRFAKSWTTDGVQVHVTLDHLFKRTVTLPVAKAPPLGILQDSETDVPAANADAFVQRSRGLFRADCVSMQHLERLRARSERDFNLVFVDPGIVNIFTSVSTPFTDWKAQKGQVHPRAQASARGACSRFGCMRATEYRHMLSLRQAAPRREEVCAVYNSLATAGGSMHVGDTTLAIRAARHRVRALIAGAVWQWTVSSKAYAQRRFQRMRRRQRAIDKLVHALSPDKTDIIVMGDWFGRRPLRGQRGCAPLRTLRRKLQRQRALVLMNEFNTSRKCASCGPVLGHKCLNVEHPVRLRTLSMREVNKTRQSQLDNDHLRVETRRINGLSMCPHCKSCWSRDINAACNFSYGFHHICQSDTQARPKYLTRHTTTTTAEANVGTSVSHACDTHGDSPALVAFTSVRDMRALVQP
jgi:hypothetical protein